MIGDATNTVHTGSEKNDLGAAAGGSNCTAFHGLLERPSVLNRLGSLALNSEGVDRVGFAGIQIRCSAGSVLP
jgi:hypothetical protein